MANNVNNQYDLLRFAQKTLFKIAFHGGFSNIWKSIMTIPEVTVFIRLIIPFKRCCGYPMPHSLWRPSNTCYFQARDVKRCMNQHDECISYEILASEAKLGQDDGNEIAEEEQRASKKKRMIINNEFVEGLDTSDGAYGYDDAK